MWWNFGWDVLKIWNNKSEIRENVVNYDRSAEHLRNKPYDCIFYLIIFLNDLLSGKV